MKVAGGLVSTSRGRQAKCTWLQGITVSQVRSRTMKGERDILRHKLKFLSHQLT